jgi:hypothetical protein
LAWIRVKQGQPILTDKIITLGRPSLRPPARSLTHICSINWPHGGVMSRRQLERLRRLEVRFDRRLKRSRHSHDDCGPHGINSCTFDVRFGGGYEDLDFVTSENMPHVVDECVAVYPIDPRGRKNRHDKPFSYLENHTVYITLKCDFILDCHGVPVDGNHMAGLLPSGDGVPGGTFESWFRVVPDHEWKDHDRDDYEREENDNEEKGI